MPLPSTARSAIRRDFVPPHGDSHEQEGGDPVLGQLLVLGTDTETTTFTTTSTTFVDTNLSVDIVSHGGDLLIMTGGAMACGRTAAGDTAQISIRAVVDSTNLFENLLRGDIINATDVNLWNPSTATWMHSVGPGRHTVKIQIKVGAANQDAGYPSSEGDAYLLVLELMPRRRS